MLFATVNGEKVEAKPKTKGFCLLCERTVFSKCGEIYVWHWTHFKGEGCESWYEPETKWHRNWKLIFGIENSEIVIKKDKVKHIADVVTNENVVIELQNSPITKQIIRKRENFYGERMLWIINGNHFEYNFQIGSLVNPFDNVESWKFELDSNSIIETALGLVNKRTGELVRVKSKIKPELHFNWSRARRSWEDVRRPVFIDFGEKDLIWVTEGMGTSRGKCKRISKECFLMKYGGNIELLATIIDKK